MDLGVNGQVFFIAGASKGLGFAIAEALAAEGATLAIASRDKNSIEAAARSLSSQYGINARGYVMDAGKGSDISAAIAAAVEDFGRLDGLVVNAGGPPPGQFDAFDDADWQAAFDLTLMSAVRMIRAALPALRTAGKGSILALTSSSVKEPIDYLLLSNVMRSGVTSLVKSLSQQLGADNIRVNNLVPGRIYTDRIRQLDTRQAETKGTSVQEIQRAEEARIPLGRYGDPAEFGRAGAFLLSEAASYISGATLVVDGATMKAL